MPSLPNGLQQRKKSECIEHEYKLSPRTTSKQHSQQFNAAQLNLSPKARNSIIARLDDPEYHANRQSPVEQHNKLGCKGLTSLKEPAGPDLQTLLD
jgi:hypothetical protein